MQCNTGDEPTAVRWIGTESGHPACPATVGLWSSTVNAPGGTAALPVPTNDCGSANGSVWAPAESDTCIRTADPSGPHTGSCGCWSWQPGTEATVKSPAELRQVFLDTVGNNANMLLNMAPDTRGLVPDADMAAYKALGDWVAESFGPTAQLGAATTLGGPLTVVKLGSKLKRTPKAIVLQEDLKEGQCVQGWSLELLLAAGASGGGGAGGGAGAAGTGSVSSHQQQWLPLANGTSIGHKHIVMPLDQGLAAKWAGVPSSELRLRVTVTDSRATGPAVIRAVGVY